MHNFYDPHEDGPLYRHRSRRATRRVVTVPKNVGPHVRLLFSEMARKGHRYDDVAVASGVTRACCKAWRAKNQPSLEGLEAVLNAIGYRFIAVPAQIEILPPNVAAKAAELAALAGIEMGEAFAAAVMIAARQLAASEEGPRVLAELQAEREVALANKSINKRRRKAEPPAGANDNAAQVESAA